MNAHSFAQTLNLSNLCCQAPVHHQSGPPGSTAPPPAAPAGTQGNFNPARSTYADLLDAICANPDAAAQTVASAMSAGRRLWRQGGAPTWGSELTGCVVCTSDGAGKQPGVKAAGQQLHSVYKPADTTISPSYLQARPMPTPQPRPSRRRATQATTAAAAMCPWSSRPPSTVSVEEAEGWPLHRTLAAVCSEHGAGAPCLMNVNS